MKVFNVIFYSDYYYFVQVDVIRGWVLLARSGCLSMSSECQMGQSGAGLLAMTVALVSGQSAQLTRLQLEGASWTLHVAILLGLSMELVVAELENSGPLRAKLGGVVRTVLVNHVTSMDPFLPRMGNADVRQWTLMQDMLDMVVHDPLLKQEKGFFFVIYLHF